MDNLNTHTATSLYEAFPPEEAQRTWQRLEVHYTPKHGSWLNMAEIEISIFERGCLSKRVKSFDHLWQHIVILATERNAGHCRIHWRFTCAEQLLPLVKRVIAQTRAGWRGRRWPRARRCSACLSHIHEPSRDTRAERRWNLGALSCSMRRVAS